MFQLRVKPHPAVPLVHDIQHPGAAEFMLEARGPVHDIRSAQVGVAPCDFDLSWRRCKERCRLAGSYLAVRVLATG